MTAKVDELKEALEAQRTEVKRLRNVWASLPEEAERSIERRAYSALKQAERQSKEALKLYHAEVWPAAIMQDRHFHKSLLNAGFCTWAEVVGAYHEHGLFWFTQKRGSFFDKIGMKTLQKIEHYILSDKGADE